MTIRDEAMAVVADFKNGKFDDIIMSEVLTEKERGQFNMLVGKTIAQTKKMGRPQDPNFIKKHVFAKLFGREVTMRDTLECWFERELNNLIDRYVVTVMKKFNLEETTLIKKNLRLLISPIMRENNPNPFIGVPGDDASLSKIIMEHD